MKTLILFAMLVLPLLYRSQNATASVAINIRLQPIQTIKIDPAQKNTAQGISSGTGQATDRVTVFSTGAFGVKVHPANEDQADDKSMTFTPKYDDNRPEDIALAMTALPDNTGNVVLSNTDSAEKTFGIKYGGGEDLQANRYARNHMPSTAATDLMYTLEVQ